MKFVIEHLEPELYEWCLIEYGHISEIIGKGNLIFTNVKNKNEENKLKKYGTVYKKNVSELNFNGACVLSQYASKTLTTNDRNRFKYLVLGGILGDNPAKKRTEDIITGLKRNKIKFGERNLGGRQMPTDVAAYVSKKILDGKKLNDFKFVDELEVQINENESINLNFRYVVDNNKVIISEKLVDHLRKRKEF